MLQNDYHTKFECDFDLHNYPFDSQRCEMVFELTGITSKYMSFVQDGMGVNYLGSNNLKQESLNTHTLYTSQIIEVQSCIFLLPD